MQEDLSLGVTPCNAAKKIYLIFCNFFLAGHEPADVYSSLSSAGILTVNAPKKEASSTATNERVIPIKQTDEIVKKDKKNGEKKSSSEKK